MSSHPHDPSGEAPREPYGDPWQAFGYLVAGVLFYGFLGWLLDRWLDTPYLVVVGIFLGAGLGLYRSFGVFGGDRPPAGRTQAAAPTHVNDTADEPKETQE